jgi:transposase
MVFSSLTRRFATPREGSEVMTGFSDVRIFLCITATNMHYSFDGLMGRAQEILEQDPRSGPLFLFMNRVRDRVKILFRDRDGFCFWYKRLERGMYQLLTPKRGGTERFRTRLDIPL